MGLFDLFRKKKPSELTQQNIILPKLLPDRSNWTGKDFEFLITGELEYLLKTMTRS